MESKFYKSYLDMFTYLDKYWEHSQDNDLGGLLGSMNPYIFEGGIPIDSSMYKDWVLICEEKYDNLDGIGIEEYFTCIIEYLSKQQLKFGINLNKVIDNLKKDSPDFIIFP